MKTIRIMLLTVILVLLLAETALGVGDFNLVYHSGSNDSTAWGDRWSVPIPEYNVALYINEAGDGYGETGYVIYVSRDGKLHNAHDRVFIKAWPDFQSAMQIRFCEIWTLDLQDYYQSPYAMSDYFLLVALHWSNEDGSVQYVTDLALEGYDGRAEFPGDRADQSGDGIMINALGDGTFEVIGGDQTRIDDILIMELGYDLEDGVNDEEELEEVMSYFPRFTGTLPGVNAIEDDPVFLQFKDFDRGTSRGMHTSLDDIKEMYDYYLTYRLGRPLYDADTGEPVATVYTRVRFDEGQGIYAWIEDVVWEAPEQPSLPVGADSADTSVNPPAINGCVSLPYLVFEETPDEVIKKALDIDLDGVSENLYYGGNAARNDLYLQFIPGTELLEGGNTAESYANSYLYLYPFAQSPTGRVDDRDMYFVPTHLSLLTGDDGELYACVESEVFGATGIPAKTLEFFQKQDDSTELVPISVDYKKFIVDTSWDNLYHGVMLQDYLAGAYCEYISGLGRWCLVFSQSDVAEYNNLSRIRLRTYLTFENGELKLIARYLDDKLVEGPYISADSEQTKAEDALDNTTVSVAPDKAFIRIESEVDDLQVHTLIDGASYTLRATAFDANGVALDDAAQDGIKWTIVEGTGQLETTVGFVPGLVVFSPDNSREQVTLVAANDELGLQEQITLNVSPFSFDLHSGNTATLTGYAGQLQNILLPMTVNVGNTDYDVTAIGARAFADSAITAAIIPEGYKTIEESAFENCMQLSTIQLPDSLQSIGELAFENCVSLTELSLGKELASIGEGAFIGCASLISFDVDLENEILYTDAESGALYAARSVDDHPSHTQWPRAVMICLPPARGVVDCVVPYEVTEIARYAFAGCSALEDVTIANGTVSLAGAYFDDSPNLRLLLYQGTDAEQTAINTGLKYERIFDWDSDKFQFVNKYGEVGLETDNYIISQKSFLQLMQEMSPSVKLHLYIKAAKNMTGVCYGMSSIAMLHRFARLVGNEKLLDKMDQLIQMDENPINNADVRNFLIYYHLMFAYPDIYIPAFKENFKLAHLEDEQGNNLTYHRAESSQKIFESLKRGIPVMVSMTNETLSVAHTIVLEKIISVDDKNVTVQCYDPNSSNESIATLSTDGEEFWFKNESGKYNVIYLIQTTLAQIDLRNYFTEISIPDLKKSYGGLEGEILAFLKIISKEEVGNIDFTERIEKYISAYASNRNSDGTLKDYKFDYSKFVSPDAGKSDDVQWFTLHASEAFADNVTIELKEEDSTFAILDDRFPFSVSASYTTTIHADFTNQFTHVKSEKPGVLRIVLAPTLATAADDILDITAFSATILSARCDEQGLFLASDSEAPLSIYHLGENADKTELFPVTEEGAYLPGSALSDGTLTQSDNANSIAIEFTDSPAPAASAPAATPDPTLAPTADATRAQEDALTLNPAPVLDIRFVYLLLALVSAAGLGAVLFALFARK